MTAIGFFSLNLRGKKAEKAYGSYNIVRRIPRPLQSALKGIDTSTP